jgi:hypothetical protein
MTSWKSDFDEQKRKLENLQARSPEEQRAITKAVRLDRQGLEFAEQGRGIEADLRLTFVEHVIKAIKDNKYGEFKTLVSYLIRSADAEEPER